MDDSVPTNIDLRVRFFCLSIFLVIPMQVFSAPYSERTAFCQDHVRGHFTSLYEMQKEYNRCMDNADKLIDEYERQSARNAEELRKWQQKESIESEKRRLIESRERLKRQEEERVKNNKRKEDLNNILTNPSGQLSTDGKEVQPWIQK